MEAWETCQKSKDDGRDIRALTVWALFGSTDWPSLLTRFDDAREVGCFDPSVVPLRTTAIATLARSLVTGKPLPPAVSAALEEKGWWRRDSRLSHPVHVMEPASANAEDAKPIRQDYNSILLIIGQSGDLPVLIEEACRTRALAVAKFDGESGWNGLAKHEEVRTLRAWALISVAPLTTAELEAACQSTSLLRNELEAGPLARPRLIRILNVADMPDFTGKSLQAAGEGSCADACLIILAVRDSGAAIGVEHAGANWTPVFVNEAMNLIIDDATGVWTIDNSGNCHPFDASRLSE